MKKLYMFLKKVILIIPLLLGIIGYLNLYPGEYTSALYFSIRLYGFNYDASQVTPILEVARWLAPLVLVTTVVLMIQSLATKINNSIQHRFYQPMMVYGNNILCEMLCEDMQKQSKKIAFLRSDKVLSSKKHVIMFENDQENLKFFARNIDLLKGDRSNPSRVYIQLEDFNDQMFNHQGVDVYPFSISYTIAQLYWRKQCPELCALVYQDKPIHIAILGSGIYAQKLLEEGLLFNIYGLHQEIHYHVYGDWQEYKMTHLSWDDIEKATSDTVKDKVHFHQKNWYESLEALLSHDKIIICEDDLGDNLHMTHKIKGLLARQIDIDVLLFDHDMFSQDTSSFNQIHLFGDYHQACTYDIVIQEQLIKNAKLQHQRYSQNELKKDSNYMIIDWYDLSNFLRNSNITSSNFTMHNLEQIKNYVQNNNTIACLEHIRWSRYHFMNNWTLGPRDNPSRKHPDLIPFEALSNEEKTKDLQAKGVEIS